MRFFQEFSPGLANNRRGLIRYRILVFLAYVGVWIVFLRHYQHVFNKDEVSYLSIAGKYSRGEFFEAINGYWAPLHSWLLAPLLITGLPEPFAAKLLMFLVGTVVLGGVGALSRVFGLSEWLRRILVLTAAPVVGFFSIVGFNADVVVAGVLCYYFSLTLDRNYAANPRAGWLSGLLGAAAYFAKGYAIYFFVAHFFLINLTWCAIPAQRSAVAKHFVTGLAVCATVASFWVGLLHWKYHKLTLGITGKYNYAIVGPESPGRPIFYMGFLPPPNATATSIWEDPSFFPPIKSWTPFDSLQAFKHQVRLARAYAYRTVAIYQHFSVFSLAVFVAALALCATATAWRPDNLPVVLTLATLLLYPAGYCLVYTEERYLWPMLFLVLFLGGGFLDLLFRQHPELTVGRKTVLLAAFALSFLVYPYDDLRNRPYRQWAFTTNALIEQLEGENLEGVKIASNTDFGAAVCIAHRFGARYYGQAKEKISEAQIVRELQQSGIDYYFVFDDAPVSDKSLVKKKELQAAGRRLAIYTVAREQ